MVRIGIGYDVHRLVQGRRLVLGGVDIPYCKGLLGHSDADVLVHAIMDALFGAAGLEDIGRHFPDSDDRYKGISSLVLLEKTGDILKSSGFTIVNIDSIIIAQNPKIMPYAQQIKRNISRTLSIGIEQVNIKATTTEGLGICGRGEGIVSKAVALLDL